MGPASEVRGSTRSDRGRSCGTHLVDLIVIIGHLDELEFAALIALLLPAHRLDEHLLALDHALLQPLRTLRTRLLLLGFEQLTLLDRLARRRGHKDGLEHWSA